MGGLSVRVRVASVSVPFGGLGSLTLLIGVNMGLNTPHTPSAPGWRSFGLGDGLYFGYVGNDDDDT